MMLSLCVVYLAINLLAFVAFSSLVAFLERLSMCVWSLLGLFAVHLSFSMCTYILSGHSLSCLLHVFLLENHAAERIS